jgi:hypothetical protein
VISGSTIQKKFPEVSSPLKTSSKNFHSLKVVTLPCGSIALALQVVLTEEGRVITLEEVGKG